MMFRTAALLLPLVACACSSVSTQGIRPSPPLEEEDSFTAFAADATPLSDPEIARLLDARWEVPSDLRIALLQLRFRSEFDPGSQGEGLATATAAVEELRGIPGVFDASYLPGFLVPVTKDLQRIRQAAATYQADWVLLYTTTVRSDHESRMFHPDEVHGVCFVEVGVLDTRTGLILFTTRSTENFHVTATSSKEDESTLLRRSENAAIESALLDSARSLATFIEAARAN